VNFSENFFLLLSLVGDVMDSLSKDELGSPIRAATIEDADISEASSDRGSKASKRTASETAVDAFREVMGSMMPARERNLPKTVDDFFKQIGITDEQRKIIVDQLHAPSLCWQPWRRRICCCADSRFRRRRGDC
jgi:hypothetical protein